MHPKKFKVIRCEHCHTLTYKRLGQKKNQCPSCNKRLSGDYIALFADARDAITFIKQEKLKEAPKQGDWFESFG